MMNETHDHKKPGGDEAPAPDAGSSAGSVAAMIGTRNLKIIIVAMPIVFLVVVGAIIAMFGRSDDGGAFTAKSVSSPAIEKLSAGDLDAPTSAFLGEINGVIELPLGAQAGAISLDGDRLALRIDYADGAMIVIYDLARESVVQTIMLTEAD